MLFRKMRRDMMRHKTQFISIFLMALLAALIYTGVGAEWQGLSKSAETYYSGQNLADVFLYGDKFDKKMEEKVASVSGIEETQRRLKIDAVGKMDGNPHLTLYFSEDNKLSQPDIISGEAFDGDKEGIWLDKRFAKARNIKIGDTIKLSVLNFKMKQKVKGIVYSPEYVFMPEADTLAPDFAQNGYAFLSKRAFPIPELLQYNNLLMKTEKTDEMKLENDIDKALDGDYSVFLMQKDHPSVSMFQNEITQHKMMADIFPLVFLVIALLTMMTTMTRIVTNQRVQIGTLKAIGFRKKSITWHYLSYGFWLSLLGVACGSILGFALLPDLFYPSMSSFYTLPQWKAYFDESFVIMDAVIVIFCTLAAWLACRKLLGERPADTLRPKAPKTFKRGLLEKTSLWKRVGFNGQWNLRDARRNWLRSLMAIIGVFGCTTLIICAFGMNRSMEDLKIWQYEDINQFESKITLEETIKAKQCNRIKKAVDGESIMESTVEIKTAKKKSSGTMTVLDDVSLIKTTDKDMDQMDLPENGLAISEKMAKSLGVRKGDTIHWHLYGNSKWIQSRIADIYRDPAVQGIMMVRDFFEDYDLKFKTTSILSAQKVTEDFDGAAAVLSTSEMKAGWDDLTEAMYIMVYLMITAAVILSVVVLYNLGLLTFTEMEREMATLKVMGVKSRKIRRLLLTQNLWFSAIGYLLGLPGGIYLIQIIVSASGDSFDFPVRLHGSTAGLAFVITFTLSILVNLMFFRKIKRLDMVESLKGIE